MENQFTRTQMLLGREAIERLHDAHVAIFGVGGVGGYVVEVLARSGKDGAHSPMPPFGHSHYLLDGRGQQA